MTRACERDTECVQTFAAWYELAGAPAMQAVELDVMGASTGVSGYTTPAQADTLAPALDLRGGMALLDLGAGLGWPGLYLASKTGCNVVLTDVPVPAMRKAAQRAAAAGISRRSACVVASGQAQPFRSRSFDRVVHTDVLCCLRPKLAVLKTCRRLLRPGGRMAFYTIFVAPGLSPAGRRRAVDAGPPAVASRLDQGDLLRAAGFTAMEEADVTAEYLRIARAYLEANLRHEAGMRGLEGDVRYEERQRDRRKGVAAIEAGLLRRSLFVASVPS
ncbi:MAG: methyltransferase domain-containing protein [Dehalococcoidia bacterium]